MFFCDMHTHSRISFDCDAPLRDMAEAAISAEAAALYVTDHCDLLDPSGRPNTHFDWAAAKAQYHDVLPAVEGRLALRLGIELGSIASDPDAARSILAEGGGEVDFVLGSVHNWIGAYGDRDLYYTDYTNAPALCREAMDNALNSTWQMVTRSPDCYDSLAHISYPPRYMRRDGQNFSLASCEEQIREIFSAVARTDHALEVNTWRGQDMEVWSFLLRWYRECGGQYVTLGSDAHAPEDVARGLREILPLLQATGFDHVTTYEKRTPVLHRL